MHISALGSRLSALGSRLSALGSRLSELAILLIALLLPIVSNASQQCYFNVQLNENPPPGYFDGEASAIAYLKNESYYSGAQVGYPCKGSFLSFEVYLRDVNGRKLIAARGSNARCKNLEIIEVVPFDVLEAGELICTNTTPSIIQLSGATETRPTQTGGTSTVTITAKVTSGGQPKAGVTVGFGVDVQTRTGGHDHGDLGTIARPKGVLSASSGVTDANGEIKIQFRAPQSSGLHAIVADCAPAGCANNATHVVTVKVPDLNHIPPDYGFTPPRYILVGNVGDAGNNYQTFNHQNTHYLSRQSLVYFNELVAVFSRLGWGQIGVNDASLEWGGMFDIEGKWLEPVLRSNGRSTTGGHAEHRNGQQVDISFVRPAAVNNTLRRRVFDEVCSNNNAELPSTILWHQNDGYAPHFHIYLTGQRPSGAPAPCSNS